MTSLAEPLKTSEPSLYDADFYAWTQDQAEKLRARARLDNRGDIDWENAAEEIGSLGRSDKKEIRSRLGVLLKHLLKWRYQANRRSTRWLETISEQRIHIAASIMDSPSLASFPAEVLDWSYAWAVRDAARETHLTRSTFPFSSPYTIHEILDPEFYPEGEG